MQPRKVRFDLKKKGFFVELNGLSIQFKGNNEAVTVLVKQFEANLEAKDHQCRTPLYLAAEHG